jgi:hypothetical protein
MTQFQYSTGSFRVSRERTTHTPQQRAVGLVFAVAMEASIVYALLVTLGWVEAPTITPPLTLVNVAPLPKNPDVPPPPPQIFDPPPVATPIVPEVVLTYAPPIPQTAISCRRPRPSRRRSRA